jgi:magnesium transporter
MPPPLNMNGIHDIACIQAIANGLGLHPMTLEDILNTYQRPRCERIALGVSLVAFFRRRRWI